MTDRMHWRYFLALEAEMAATARYVDFEPTNMGTYSIEFLRLLLAAGAECDVVLQQICNRWGELPDQPKITDYQAAITPRYSRFGQIGVSLPRYQLGVRPWETWAPTPPDKPASPTWWKAYTATKHRRHDAYPSANLENALNAVAGLFVTILVLHKLDGTLRELTSDLPVLLEVDKSPAHYLVRGYDIPEIPSEG